MKKFAKKICQNKKTILIISIILFFASLIGMYFTKVNYDILVYLPKDIETIKGQDILTNDFEMGAYSVAVAENLSSKDILKLEEKIKEVDGVNKVVSIYDVLGTTIDVEMLPSEITSHLHNENTDILFITFYDGTSSERTIDAVKEIRTLSSSLDLGGMSSMVLDTMNLSESEITIYIIIAVVLCIIVLELSLDSYLAPILLLLNIGFAIILNLGTNIFLKEISYITKALVAVLQLGVTTDFSIFLYHSYEDKKAKFKDNKGAMIEAICETFSSVIGSSLTTIAGFLVLCFMQLTLGKDLGIVMAKGVLLGLLSVLTLYPCLILTFDKLLEKTKHKKINLKFNRLNTFIVNHHKTIFCIFLILIIPLYLSYRKCEVYYKIDASLPDTLESVRANTYLKDNYNIVSPEIILLDVNDKPNDVSKLVDELRDVEGIDFVLSFDKLAEYGLTDNMISEDLLKIFKSDKYQMVLVNSLYEVASDELNEQIEVINKIVKDYDKDAIVAGEGPLMKDLITTSDNDFKNVNIYSIVFILIILLCVLKNAFLPLLLILAIEGAIFANMSISYYSGAVLPFVASIVLGTIQLGATIDYAILLTTTYKNNRKEMPNKCEAMIKALNYNGASILTSGLCFFAATFGVGVYSDIDMVGSLCTLISRGALISMMTVILVLPGILLICDKLFIKKKGNDNKMRKNKKLALFSLGLALVSLSSVDVEALTRAETVYGKLETNGTSKYIYVNERLLNDAGLNEIDDYTVLKNILNINGEETYKIDGDKITWESNGNDIFYQGTYEDSLPISLDITYKLDGKDIVLKDLLGQSGKVTITIKYTNNDKHTVSINGQNKKLYTPFTIIFGTVIDSNAKEIKITNGKIMSTGTKNVVVALAAPGLAESLNVDSLEGLNKIVLEYKVDDFELNSMYNVVMPKLISSSDLDILNNLDDLYDSVSLLSKNMDLLDESAKKIKDGSNSLKSGLSNSINELKNDNSDALDEETLKTIVYTSTSSVQNAFNDEYKENIKNTAWKKVEQSLTQSDENINKIVENNITEILTNYATTKQIDLANDTLVCLTAQNEGKDLSGMTAEEQKACMNLNEINTLKELLLNGLSKNTSEVSAYVAEKVSKSVAAEVSYQTAVETTQNVSESVAKLVANSIKKASVNSITSSLNSLYENVSLLDSGIAELANGISKYNEEGIKTISSVVNDDVKDVTTRLEKVIKLGEDYKSIMTSKNLDKNSETKFVLVVDGEKKEEIKKISTTTKTKTTLWEKIKNIFK